MWWLRGSHQQDIMVTMFWHHLISVVWFNSQGRVCCQWESMCCSQHGLSNSADWDVAALRSDATGLLVTPPCLTFVSANHRSWLMMSSFSSLAPVVAEPRQRFGLAVIHAPPFLLTSGMEVCRPPLLHYSFPPAPLPFCHCPPSSPPSLWAHSWSNGRGSCLDQPIKMSQRSHRGAWSCQKKPSYSWRVPLWVRR